MPAAENYPSPTATPRWPRSARPAKRRRISGQWSACSYSHVTGVQPEGDRDDRERGGERDRVRCQRLPRVESRRDEICVDAGRARRGDDDRHAPHRRQVEDVGDDDEHDRRHDRELDDAHCQRPRARCPTRRSGGGSCPPKTAPASRRRSPRRVTTSPAGPLSGRPVNRHSTPANSPRMIGFLISADEIAAQRGCGNRHPATGRR